ncbi:MAG: hypothetical protein EBR82_40495 [Caulobacteraceae bacterium]|nr:hypothetical protein [Caulobacteraceae bacterium]
MPLTSAARLRSRITDPLRVADVTNFGDGTASTYALQHVNLQSASAFVPGAGGWSATAATFDPTGYVTFGTAISANSAWRARYVYSVFSDDEIDDWLTVGGSIVGAAKLAVKTLMFDGVKRARWTAPDGSSFDDTAAIATLKNLWELLSTEEADGAIAAGSAASWSLDQEGY